MLNENEQKVLDAVVEAIKYCTGNEFGYSEDVKKFTDLPIITLSGYMSQLVQKGYVTVHEDYGQIELLRKAAEAATDDNVRTCWNFAD